MLTIMAKYVPIEMVKEYHGKICEHSDVYFAKKGKTLYTGKVCRAAVKALTSEQKATYAEAFANQKKYSTLNGFMFAEEYAKIV